MESIQQALREVGELHQAVTQAPAPEIAPHAFVPFPPGVDPVAFAIEEVARLRQLVQQAPRPQAMAWVPSVSIHVGPASILVAVDLAGVSQEDVAVTIEGADLVVRGVRRPPVVDPAFRPVLVEQAWGPFERRLAIPVRVDPKAVAARYDRGILEITLPGTEAGSADGFAIKIG